MWKFEHHQQIGVAQKILTVLVGVVQLILAIVALATFTSSASNIIDVTTTWTAVPINDMRFVTGATCPTGYTEWARNPYFAGVTACAAWSYPQSSH